MFQENRGLLDKNRTEGYLIEKGDFMDFRDLSYVLAIAKTQNITKAADSLYVTQPTLTKFLQNLEKEMGQKLFRKLGNRFVLTYAGERYVAKATEILNLKKELDQEMGDIKMCIRDRRYAGKNTADHAPVQGKRAGGYQNDGRHR